MCEEILNSEFLVVMAAVQKKVELELSLEKSAFCSGRRDLETFHHCSERDI